MIREYLGNPEVGVECPITCVLILLLTDNATLLGVVKYGVGFRESHLI
jgi:hypothetical protein